MKDCAHISPLPFDYVLLNRTHFMKITSKRDFKKWLTKRIEYGWMRGMKNQVVDLGLIACIVCSHDILETRRKTMIFLFSVYAFE